MMGESDLGKAADSGFYENQPNPMGLTGRISLRARRAMFEQLMALVRPAADWTVLDVGVTCNRREESNFFEKLYPWPARITATGLEDASFLEEDFPGLRFVRTDAGALPFSDGKFDLVVCFAVLEHVGSRASQAAFVRELCRVGRRVYLTTPNRAYPIEFHTLTPFLHWLPPERFRWFLRAIGNDYYAREENLNLLRESEVAAMRPSGWRVRTAHHRLLGLVSNLVFYAERP